MRTFALRVASGAVHQPKHFLDSGRAIDVHRSCQEIAHECIQRRIVALRVLMAGSWELWLYDFGRGVSTPLVQGEGHLLVVNPVWAPGDTAACIRRVRVGAHGGHRAPSAPADR